MPYGILKVDQVTFTNAGVDQTISVSGIVASISGNITATGTISGNVIRGGTLVSGATVTGTAGQFGTITGNTAGFTTVTGTTVTGTTAQFTTVTGGTAGFTTITGTTVTGTTANFVTVSGTTVTGNVGNFTTITGGSAGFTTVTGTTITGTTLTVASGTFTGNSTAAAFIPTGSTVPTNGVYLPAANSVAVATNGTGRLFVNSTGSVGIGFSSPADILNVKTDGNTGWELGSAGSGLGSRLISYDRTAGVPKPAVIASETFSVQTSTTGGGLTSRLFVNSSGSVGIGTTTPSAILDVKVASDAKLLVQDGNTTGNVKFNAVNNAVSANVNLEISASNTQFFNGGSERARIDSSGRLLVGTSTARSNFFNSTVSSQFQVEGTSTTGRIISVISSSSDGNEPPFLVLGKQNSGTVGGNTAVASGANVGVVSFQANDGTEFVEAARIEAQVDGTPGANDMPGRLVFSTCSDGSASPQERMRITSGGFLKASNTGTYVSSSDNIHEFNTDTSNSYAFRVRHNGTSGQQYGIEIKTANDQNDATRTFLDCFGGGAARVILRSNGGIANYSANNANLSDRNTKKDISAAAATWDCIKEWEIVNFRYKDQPDDADLNLGVIAQQVGESCPEVITVFQEAKEATEDQPAQEERLGVKEQQMYWMAIKALQEAQVRIEALEAEVAALKAQ
jgi:hypothetical protein